MNIRGARLHQALLFDGIEVREPEGEREQGRNAELQAERDEHLFCRYIYYIETDKKERKLNREWILGQLRKEFHLSEVRIGDILEANDEKLKAMRRNPDLKGWKGKYEVKW